MDLNGDGRLDVISGQYSPPVVSVFLGAEKGFFEKRILEEDRTGVEPMATGNFADWDGDGDLDLLVGDVSGTVSLNENLGSKTAWKFGKRVRLMVGDQPLRVGTKSDPLPVDWDGDGILDLIVGDEAGDVVFFRRNKEGGFAQGVSMLTGEIIEKPGYRDRREALAKAGVKGKLPGYRLRVETADWNDDGLLDLLIGNCESGKGGTTGYVFVLLRKPVSNATR